MEDRSTESNWGATAGLWEPKALTPRLMEEHAEVDFVPQKGHIPRNDKPLNSLGTLTEENSNFFQKYFIL